MSRPAKFKRHRACQAAIAFLAIVCLLFPVEVISAQICKWVDADGVVHYAESCPEGVHSQEVEIRPAPSQKQIDEAVNRSQQSKDKRAARDAQQSLQQEQQFQERQELQKKNVFNKEKCMTASQSAVLLSAQLPVYLDDQNRLQCDRSLHHYWYQGKRRYLDDSERIAALEESRELIKAHCEGQQIQLTELLVKTYRGPPNSSETIKMLEYPEIYSESQENTCSYANFVLEDFRKSITGIPTQLMRELEVSINKECR